MKRPIAVFGPAEVSPLAGPAFRETLLAELERASWRLWASLFLVGLEADDSVGSARCLLDAFVRASLRHVDVRVLVDDFTAGIERAQANAVAAGYLAARGVPVRVYTGPKGRSSHSKFVLADDDVLVVGSGNLTPGGLDSNAELALRIVSADLNRDLAGRYELGWNESTPWRDIR